MLKIVSLKKYFPIKGGFFSKKRGVVKALDDINLSLEAHKTLCVVGESGSGKTTLAKIILNLIPPTEGKVYFNNCEISRSSRKDIQIVFQNKDASLSPRKTLYEILKEPLVIHNIQDKEKRIDQLLSLIGFSRNELKKYPHQFSGGQKQRIAIARALSIKPKLLVADEPVSSLDAEIKGGIINLLSSLTKEGLSLLFISHDLRMVEYIADDVAVLYLGRIVEYAPSSELFKNPQHPYTKALISSIPPSNPKERKQITPLLPPDGRPEKGCIFYPRCREKKDTCEIKEPPSIVLKGGHFVSCFI